MDTRIDPAIPAELRELVITRTFDAPRDLVWQAWTDPRHIAQWWGPHGYDAPHPSVDLRVGGKMNLDMRDPDGNILPATAIIRELKPPEKLSFVSTAFMDAEGEASLEVLQSFTFTETKGKTTLTLKATVLRAAAEVLPALQGMKQGWTETLDKFGEHLGLTRWGTTGGDTVGTTSFVVPGNAPYVVLQRTFNAPRDLVWQALTDPKLRAQWWGPRRYTTNVRELDAREGGKWRIDHDGEDGKTYSFWGEFLQVRAPQRMVNTFRFADFPPATEVVTLSEHNTRTTVTNVTRVDTMELRNGLVSSGMESGARDSMDRLAELVEGKALADKVDAGHRDFAAKQATIRERKVAHGSFTIDRVFDAPQALVFGAFADPKAKARWFGGPPGWTQAEKSMDFRVGGREVSVGGPPGGPTSKFDATYYDIVPNQRIVYAYEMHLDDVRISVSVATLEFRPAGPGTRLVLTEQGAFLDGFDNPGLREEGTRHLMEQIARYLKQAAAA